MPAARSLEDRRARAVAGAKAAAAALRSRGVETLIVGSLAKGGFGPWSDVDILVTACPRALRYAIEGHVEDCLGDIPGDVLYLDEVPAWKRPEVVAGAIDAAQLR